MNFGLSEEFIFKKIVFTGGPCGGKTSALPFVAEKLREMDYVVVVVPEAATLCINAGIVPGKNFAQLKFQSAIMDMGFKTEEVFVESIDLSAIQKSGAKGVVLLCDRGIVDGMAYMPKMKFKELLLARGQTLVSVRDVRYDAVIHMRSTAIGAEDFYTCENNTARTETLEEARALDSKTLDAWTDHPHIREINNETDFEGKLHRVLQEVCAVLGEPIPLESEKKLLVKVDLDILAMNARPSEIVQTYLLTPDNSHELRVRKRGQDGEYFYTLTEKRDHGPGQRLEIERIISESDYNCYLRMKDPKRKPIEKTRYCFFYMSQYLEIDIYEEPIMPGSNWNAVLEIEQTVPNTEIYIPEWITSPKDVTNNPNFRNSAIALRLAKR
jgi:CYTH domain-containing protein